MPRTPSLAILAIACIEEPVVIENILTHLDKAAHRRLAKRAHHPASPLDESAKKLFEFGVIGYKVKRSGQLHLLRCTEDTVTADRGGRFRPQLRS